MIWYRRQLYLALFAARHVWRFRLRSSLMMLSGILGVGGVTTASSYAAAGRLQVLEQLSKMGANVLVVAARQGRATGTRARTGELVTTLTERDLQAIRREVASIEASTPIVTGTFLVKHGDLAKNDCAIVGAEASFDQIKNWPVRAGQFFSPEQVRHAQRVAVLGSAVAQDLFDNQDPIGEKVFINRIPFEVIGVMGERGQGLDAGNDDNEVFVPLRTAAMRLLNIDYYSSILILVEQGTDLDDASRGIESVLLRTHHPVGGSPVDFEVRNQKALVATRVTAAGRLDRYVSLVGASALAMSGLGIFAICWVSVGERRVEIGLRRAMGATAGDIFAQFLLEGIGIGVVASLVGMIVAWVSSAMIARLTGAPFFIAYGRMVFVGFAAIFLNLALSVLPSRRAALIDPAMALRSG
jgi:putative ABC transport system permease protein